MNKKSDIIIVTDPGVDDATALMYSIFSNKINIKLLCIAGGNSSIENTTNNALYLMELLKYDVPVAVGLDHPLRQEKSNFAEKVHGKCGLGGVNVNPKKLSTKPIETPACDAMYETLKKSKKKLSIVAIGPMTCVAEMLEKYNDAQKYIQEVIFMGGTKEKIYGRPYKEFNISFDPDCVDVVIKSGVPLVMVPMELGHFAYLNKKDIKAVKHINKIGKLFAKMYKKYHDFHVGSYGAAVHDVCTIYYLTHPKNMKIEKGHIELKYYQDEKEKFGYIDTCYDKEPNALICVDMDILRFKYDLFDAFDETNSILQIKS